VTIFQTFMHIIGSCTCLAEKLGHLFFFPPNRQSHKTRTATRVFRRGRFAVIKSWDESRVCKKGIWACSVCDRAVVHSYALVIKRTKHLNLAKYEKFTIFLYKTCFMYKYYRYVGENLLKYIQWCCLVAHHIALAMS